MRDYEFKRIRYSDEIPPRLIYSYKIAEPAIGMKKARDDMLMADIYINEADTSSIYLTELTATSSRYWLKSRYVHRVTIMIELTPDTKNNQDTFWLIKAFDRKMESYSMLYFTVFMISILAFFVFNTKRENLPHIFGGLPPEKPHDV
ncbi:MAG: hypothetical protein AB1746_01010 [Candidatus Zixiibacteriota bacterium]